MVSFLANPIFQENDYYGSDQVSNDATATDSDKIVALQETDNPYYM
jgi:hypothetical protein